MSKIGLARGKLGMGGMVLRLIPARTRRAITLTSVYAMLSGKEPTANQLTQLNNVFALVGDVKGLGVPARAPELFWGEDCLATLSTISEHDARQTFILQNLPKWLVYSNVLDVANDVNELLHFAETRLSAVAIVPDSKEPVRMVATA